MAKIKPGQMTDEIVKALQEYSSDVEDELEDAKDEVTKEGVKKLRLAGSFKQRSGSYKRGWRIKKESNRGPVIIYNATNYQLTHLLEFGHAKRGGGRTRTFVHIAPVEEWINKAFEKRVKLGISQPRGKRGKR
ncbi:HK97 gp10 family phage protein [Periweissella fabaria]|uniref:HK97 gp10 family phage protein n=1 Tax=Periweissella fabaria TaxID=546157 RepID=A0ABM8Z858_9LACO|nr:HK97 gp10 family phage protein [Periweissella fabaria]MCM0596276.1 HK97 gp10 family phage protein [Periweissella fabaria]CAH0417472.1 hypothetical protein WFA24289_01813 [Periweissella fabaria]